MKCPHPQPIVVSRGQPVLDRPETPLLWVSSVGGEEIGMKIYDLFLYSGSFDYRYYPCRLFASLQHHIWRLWFYVCLVLYSLIFEFSLYPSELPKKVAVVLIMYLQEDIDNDCYELLFCPSSWYLICVYWFLCTCVYTSNDRWLAAGNGALPDHILRCLLFYMFYQVLFLCCLWFGSQGSFLDSWASRPRWAGIFPYILSHSLMTWSTAFLCLSWDMLKAFTY